MAEQYCIWVVSPPGYNHSHAFDEIALGLQCAFRELGYEAPAVRAVDEIEGRPIVLGCNLIPHLGALRIPEGAVMYNLEQIQPSSPWMTPRYIDLLRSYEVWDYSRKNMEELARFGVEEVRFCGIGYVPELT
ncbi:MAG: glycosyltransferase family 1 protein, partial [Deltaproteobacteria bacterium]|nr:glycosyltransferase family 1 protein [Deltaproteobacteria bacterium]